MSRRPAQQRADPRQNLFEVERLGYVIVGTGIETAHLVAPAVAGGEQQDGHGPSGAAPGLQHGNAVHLRQADIENDRVVGLGLAQIMPLFAVERPVDDIAGVRQGGRKLAVEIRIILDNEETQGKVLR